jgi:hypothetical protein
MAGEAGTNPTNINQVGQEKAVEDIEAEIEKDASFVMLEFKIDPEFKDLIPPLDPATREDLKKSLQKEGCRDKLAICKLDDQFVILDGHNRYEICKELDILFETAEINVSNRTEAKIWIIKNQRSRRNLDESQRAMLAVRLEALYAEDAKSRQGTRTDLGKELVKKEEKTSAEKAAKDMGVSHQTVSFAKIVSNKCIPEIVKLVESGKVAVSAASKAASLGTESQKTIVEKVEAQIKDGKHANVTAIIREITPKNSENDAEERFGKTKKNLATCLKLLEGIEITKSQENLAEMRALLEKLMARLNEIGTINPDSSSQDVAIATDSFQTEIKEEPKEENSENVESIEDKVDNEFADDGLESVGGDSSNSMDDLTELPEDWDFYKDAMENENENQTEI